MDGGGARAGDRRACARRGRGGRRPAAAGLALARDAPRHAQHGPEPDPSDLPRRPAVVVQDPARDLLDPGDRRRRHRLRRLGRHELLRDRSRRQRALALRHRRDHRRRRRARPGARSNGEFPITIGSGDETLYQLRSSNRKLSQAKRTRWTYRTPLQPATGQLVNWWEGNVAYGPDSNLYVGNTGGGAYSLTPDGQQRWITQRANSVWTTPAFDAAGNSYWGSVDFYAFSLDPAGNQRWQTFTPGYLTSSPALGSDGTVYIGSFDRSLHALDPATGAERWAFPTADHIYSSPALASDAAGNTTAIYIGSADGSVYAVAPDGHQLLALRHRRPGALLAGDRQGAQGRRQDRLRRLLQRLALRARRRDRRAALVVRHDAEERRPRRPQRPQRLARARQARRLHRRRARPGLVRPLRLLPPLRQQALHHRPGPGVQGERRPRVRGHPGRDDAARLDREGAGGDDARRAPRRPPRRDHRRRRDRPRRQRYLEARVHLYDRALGRRPLPLHPPRRDPQARHRLPGAASPASGPATAPTAPSPRRCTTSPSRFATSTRRPRFRRARCRRSSSPASRCPSRRCCRASTRSASTPTT